MAAPCGSKTQDLNNDPRPLRTHPPWDVDGRLIGGYGSEFIATTLHLASMTTTNPQHKDLPRFENNLPTWSGPLRTDNI